MSDLGTLSNLRRIRSNNISYAPLFENENGKAKTRAGTNIVFNNNQIVQTIFGIIPGLNPNN